MKYTVTVGTLFIDGKKYRRGDVVEVVDAAQYGVRLEPLVEPVVEEKPKPKRRTRAKKVEA